MSESLNPLTEADPRSLDHLFSLDPLALSRDESAITAIVAELRRQRERWQVGEAQGKPKGKKKVDLNLKFDDLGI